MFIFLFGFKISVKKLTPSKASHCNELVRKEWIYKMIYCQGRTKSYLESKIFCDKNNIPFKKKGRDLTENPPYEGGSVWKTKEECFKECPKAYSVFGVLADWEKDTVKNIDENVKYRDLLIDANIVILD